MLADAPAHFIAYDLLEWAGQDQRERPQRERRALLEALLQDSTLTLLSPLAQPPTGRRSPRCARKAGPRGVEGFMLKHREAAYGTGRTKAEGTWWKWKIEPYPAR